MLSIIIPTLNEENYLPFLLESIKNQDFKDYEIIVADAGSHDKTGEIAKNFGCKVVSGGLPAKGRNEGTKFSRGNLLLFLDADLKLPEGFLNNSLKEFDKRKLDIASYYLKPETGSKIIKAGFDFFYNRPIDFTEKFLAHGAMGILVKKEIFKKIGGFDEKIKLAEDHYFARQGAKIGRFGIIKSTKIYISLRRFEKDGYFKTFFKYLCCHFYMFSGKAVKSDVFGYRFSHYSKTEPFSSKEGAKVKKRTKSSSPVQNDKNKV